MKNFVPTAFCNIYLEKHVKINENYITSAASLFANEIFILGCGGEYKFNSIFRNFEQ